MQSILLGKMSFIVSLVSPGLPKALGFADLELLSEGSQALDVLAQAVKAGGEGRGSRPLQ